MKSENPAAVAATEAPVDIVVFMQKTQEMKSFIDLIKPDLSKLDKAKFISGTELIVDSLKPTTTLPGNWDDSLWDMLKGVITNFFITPASADHVVVGDVNFTELDVDGYLKSLGAVQNMEATRNRLRAKPNTIRTLKANFTEAEQKKIVGNPFIIGLLTLFGPMVIDLIKKWLLK